MMEGVWDSSELGQTCGKGKARNGKLIRTARAKSDTIAACFRQSFSLAWLRRAFAGESLNLLVNASASFSAAIVHQLAAVQSDPSPGKFVQKTVAYAQAKAAYFDALRAAM